MHRSFGHTLFLCFVLIAGCGGGGGGGGGLGQGKFVYGALSVSGALGAGGTTRFYTLTLPVGTTSLFVLFENANFTDGLDVHIGQPADRTAIADYDFTLSVPAGTIDDIEVPLTVAPGSGYMATRRVTIAVHYAAGTEGNMIYGLMTAFDPVAADRYEDNDSQATARSVSRDGTFTALTREASDDDFYSVTNTATVDVDVTISFSETQGNLDLQLLDAGGSVVDSSTGGGNTHTVTTFGQPVGTYTVRVTGAAPGDAATYIMVTESN